MLIRVPMKSQSEGSTLAAEWYISNKI